MTTLSDNGASLHTLCISVIHDHETEMLAGICRDFWRVPAVLILLPQILSIRAVPLASIT